MREHSAAPGVDTVVIHVLDPTATTPARVMAITDEDVYEFDRLAGDRVKPTIHIRGTAVSRPDSDDIPQPVETKLQDEGFTVAGTTSN